MKDVNEIPGLLGPRRGYTDMLDESLMKKQAAQNEKPRDKNPLRPSASGYCARKLAYDYNEYRGNAKYEPEVKDPKTMRLLDLGSSIEWNLLKLFQGVEGLQVRYKQQTLSFFPLKEGELPLEGSIDFVFVSDKHKMIGDVKSKKDKFSSWTASAWKEMDYKLSHMQTVAQISDTAFWVDDLPAFLKELRDPFFEDNFVQANFYAMNPFIVERGIDHGAIIQYNKNDSSIREIRFRPSQYVYDYVESKFKNVAKAVDELGGPEMVEREYNLGSMRCAFCQYNKLCYPNQNALKDYFSTWPKKDWPQDTSRLDEPLAAELEGMYASLQSAANADTARKNIEEDIVKLMDLKQINKIRFADGAIYELKFLKSPRPHLELRRSKV